MENCYKISQPAYSAKGVRSPWIDFLRGIAMICVIYWHAGSIKEFNALTGAYYMPMFFALSGYLFSPSGGLRIIKLFKRIYLPLLIFGVLPGIAGPLLRHDFITVLETVLYRLTAWFLPTFFASSILFRLMSVKIKDSLLMILASLFVFCIGLMLSQYEWAADYFGNNICLPTILVGQGYIMLGYIWQKYESNHIFDLRKYKLISTCGLLIFLALEFLTQPGQMVDIHTNTYPTLPIGMGLIISSLLFGYSWTRDICFEGKLLRPFSSLVCFVGRYAIIVYLLHLLIIDCLDSFVLGSIYPHVKRDWMNAFVYTTFTIIILYCIIVIIKRLAPVLLGEKK